MRDRCSFFGIFLVFSWHRLAEPLPQLLVFLSLSLSSSSHFFRSLSLSCLHPSPHPHPNLALSHSLEVISLTLSFRRICARSPPRYFQANMLVCVVDTREFYRTTLFDRLLRPLRSQAAKGSRSSRSSILPRPAVRRLFRSHLRLDYLQLARRRPPAQRTDQSSF